MTQFVMKPVEIEARQLNGTVESANRILGWIGSNGRDAKRVHATRPELGLVIHALEGEMRAEPGDWIIRSAEGAFHPCKPDIFAATYEPVEVAL
jgi:hypothetical protein